MSGDEDKVRQALENRLFQTLDMAEFATIFTHARYFDKVVDILIEIRKLQQEIPEEERDESDEYKRGMVTQRNNFLELCTKAGITEKAALSMFNAFVYGFFNEQLRHRTWP